MKAIPTREWPPAAANWLTLQQAVHLTGTARQTIYGRVQRAAEQDAALGRESRVVLAPCCGGSVRKVLWIHRLFDPGFALSAALDVQKKFDEQRFADKTDAAIELARKKARWVVAWAWLRDSRKEHSPTTRKLARDIVAEARRREGAGFRISGRSLETWWRKYTAPAGDGRMAGVAALIYEYSAAARHV